MKYFNSVFIICIQLLFAFCLSAQLTIHVTSIPANTPATDDIFLAGTFNNWNPGNTSYILTKYGNGTFSITFTPPQGVIQYKFTRGSWETVEGNSSGGFIPNRTYNYTGGTQTVNVSIAGWEGQGGNHTAAANVMIIDEDFYMPQFNRTRRIWIYLPPDYDTSIKYYPVIYMQDGQNLFDTYYSFAGEWKIDESMNDLFDEVDYGAIVVGIDNGGNERINEYSPYINSNYGGGDGELYASFIVNTLKPYIDSNYRTLPSREYTAIAGSSLGANISLYTGIEYQSVFSKVALFSPAFWFSDSLYQHVLATGVSEEMRLYFVAGDNESATIVEDMVDMYDALQQAGVNENDMELLHHQDGAHSEWYWAREYPDAYKWLFGEIVLSTRPLRIASDFIFPNPVEKFIRIKSEKLDVPYTIYSLLGNKIGSSIASQDTIDVSSLPPGLYFLEIRVGENEYYISKFIKGR